MCLSSPWTWGKMWEYGQWTSTEQERGKFVHVESWGEINPAEL